MRNDVSILKTIGAWIGLLLGGSFGLMWAYILVSLPIRHFDREPSQHFSNLRSAVGERRVRNSLVALVDLIADLIVLVLTALWTLLWVFGVGLLAWTFVSLVIDTHGFTRSGGVFR